MTRITIDPITRLEGHGKIEIFLDDAGEVSSTAFQVPELRGFEQFCIGRPVEEMPVLVNRICGVCPEAHHMAAAKAADAVYGVVPPRAAILLRELLYSAFFVADHTTHFYALSGPDFIVGPDAPVAERNLLGVLQKVGSDAGLRVIETRRRCHRVVEIIGGRAVHPCTSIPGGLTKGITPDERDEIRDTATRMVDFAEFSLGLFDQLILGNPGYVEMITGETYRHETYSMGLVDPNGRLALYDGQVRVVAPDGTLHGQYAPDAHEHCAKRMIGEITGIDEPLDTETAADQRIDQRADDNPGQRCDTEIDQPEVGRVHQIAHAVAHRTDEGEGLHFDARRRRVGHFRPFLPFAAPLAAGQVPAGNDGQADDGAAEDVVAIAAEVRRGKGICQQGKHDAAADHRMQRRRVLHAHHTAEYAVERLCLDAGTA